MTLLEILNMSESILPGSIATEDLVAQTFTLNSIQVTGIANDPTIGSSADLVTGAALSTAVATLVASIQTNVQNVLNGVDGQVVLTQNLISSVFATTTTDSVLGWTMVGGWQNTNDTAVISNPLGTFATTNNVSIPSSRYPNTGMYLLTFTVTTLSGSIDVVFNNTTIATITATGTYNYLVTVTNTLNTTLNLVAVDVSVGGSTVLSSPQLTGINQALYNTIYYISNELVDSINSSGITSAVATALQTAETFATNAVTTSMDAHLEAANPHPQYALLANLSNTTILPDIITISPDAYVPYDIPGFKRLKSSTILKTSILNHISNSSYCAQSGYLTSNTVTSLPLAEAVINSNTTENTAFTLFNLDANALPILNYTFNQSRVVSQVILYTKIDTDVTCVTQASITVNGTTDTITITPGDSGVIITENALFSDITTNEIIITVLSVDDVTQPSIALGFSVLFDTPTGKNLVISGDTSVSINYNGQCKPVAVGSDIGIATATLIYDHQYTVSLTTTDGVTLTPEILSISPNFGEGALLYKYVFDYLTSDSDPYYGTVSITGTSADTNYHEIYTIDGAITANSNEIVLTQTFANDPYPNNYITIDHINLRFPETLASGFGYPTTITITVVQSTGTSVPITLTPNFSYDGFSTEWSVTESLLSYGPLSSFTIDLVSASGTNCGLNKIDVAIPCLAYDTSTHLWSDGTIRKVIGCFTPFSNGIIQVLSQPTGTECVVPVNDLLETDLYTNYTINNPFQTSNIEIIPLDAISYAPTGNIVIQEITDSFITVLATTVGNYLLNIIRLF